MTRRMKNTNESPKRPLYERIAIICCFIMVIFIATLFIGYIVYEVKTYKDLDKFELNSEWQEYANNLEKEIVDFMNDIGGTKYSYSKMRVLSMDKHKGNRRYCIAGEYDEFRRVVRISNPPEFPQDVDEDMFMIVVHETIHFIRRNNRYFVNIYHEEFFVQWLTLEFCKDKVDIQKSTCPYDDVVEVLRVINQKIPDLLIYFLRDDEKSYRESIINSFIEAGYEGYEEEYYTEYVNLFYEVWESIFVSGNILAQLDSLSKLWSLIPVICNEIYMLQFER